MTRRQIPEPDPKPDIQNIHGSKTWKPKGNPITMDTVRQLLFSWDIYAKIILSIMQNILILTITYYWITEEIMKITNQNIVIWE